MFSGSLGQGCTYDGLNPRIAQGLEYLAGQDLEHLAEGKYPIDGQKLWLLVVNYNTKPYEEAFFEGHEHLAEVHLALDGEEQVYWAPKEEMEQDPEDEEQRAHDKYYYTGQPAGQLCLKGGRFAGFLPEDIHMTKVMTDQPRPIRKAVLKIQLEG